LVVIRCQSMPCIMGHWMIPIADLAGYRQSSEIANKAAGIQAVNTCSSNRNNTAMSLVSRMEMRSSNRSCPGWALL
jgi:hypothetical protein